MEPATKKSKTVVTCKGEGCTETRVGPDKTWHGRLCGSCKAAYEATRRTTLTYDAWTLKVKKLSGWGKQPKREQFINQEEFDKTIRCWIENSRLTFDTWKQSHLTRKNAKGFGSKQSLHSVRHQFKNEAEFSKALNFWELNHKNTKSYANVLRYQRNNLHRIKDVRRKNGTDQDTRMCTQDGCTKIASFGGEDGKRLFCATHKDHGMEHLVARKCKHDGCTIQATYALEGKPAEYCSEHARGKVGYMDRVTKQCEIEGCTVTASYGTEGSLSRTHCAHHGKEAGLVSVMMKICSTPGCVVSAGFALPGHSREKCNIHKEPEMINVNRHTCRHSGCISEAHYGEAGHYAEWCDKHKITRDGVIFNPTKQCEHEECRKYATHGRFHKTIHCEHHASLEDIPLFEHTCSQCALVDILSPGQMCEHCSTDFRVSSRGYAERSIKHLLDLNQIDYVHEHAIGNTRLVPDFLIRAPTHSIVLEVDENQHKSSMYSTQNARYGGDRNHEVRRMRDMICVNKDISVFIRYNPHEYSGADNVAPEQRRATLLDVIRQAAITSYDTPYVVKLFFDGYTAPIFDKL